MIPPSDDRFVRYTGRAVKALFTVAWINFMWFAIETMVLGGDALNGKVEDGRYYLKLKGKYTEVSRSVWNYSYAHAVSVCVTHPVGFVGGGVLVAYALWRARAVARTQPGREEG
jgi:hypothetical protein